MTVALGLVIALGVSGCKGSSAPSAAAAPATQQASQAASAPASPPVATSSAAPGSSTGFQNLAVSAAVRSELLDAYAAGKNIPVSDVAGTRPGSVYYGYDPATQTYWAMANYEPTTTDPLSVMVGFQDGGSLGYYKKAGSGPWQVSLGGAPAICSELRFFPQAVLEAWSQPTSPPPAAAC
jgi:hypothetical protein